MSRFCGSQQPFSFRIFESIACLSSAVRANYEVQRSDDKSFTACLLHIIAHGAVYNIRRVGKHVQLLASEPAGSWIPWVLEEAAGIRNGAERWTTRTAWLKDAWSLPTPRIFINKGQHIAHVWEDVVLDIWWCFIADCDMSSVVFAPCCVVLDVRFHTRDIWNGRCCRDVAWCLDVGELVQ